MVRPESHAYRFYAEWASWWPLISPVEEYADEMVIAGDVLGRGKREVAEVLELGSGGGHNAFHLKRRFSMTLTDLSPTMLAASRQLNPECEHLGGDMRTMRLGRSFDAVFVHDAIDYMRTEHDLAQAMATAFAHCRPGGVAVLLPDYTSETFEPSTDHGGSDAADGRGVRYLAWARAASPALRAVETDYAFVFRHADGTVEHGHETHVTGLVPRARWLTLLAEAGFSVEAIAEPPTVDWHPRTLFVGHRPS